MEEEVQKYLDFEGLSLYHQNIQTEFDQKVDKVDFYNDEKIIASALNDLNTRKVNNDDLANVATSGNYNDLNNKPTKVSEFTNDAGYVTEQDISGKADQSDLEDLEEEVINNEEVIANALSILSDRIEDNEKVTASALTDLQEKKYEKPNGGIPASDLDQTSYATDSDILALFDSTATQPDANKLVRIGQLSTFLNKIKEIIEE